MSEFLESCVQKIKESGISRSTLRQCVDSRSGYRITRTSVSRPGMLTVYRPGSQQRDCVVISHCGDQSYSIEELASDRLAGDCIVDLGEEPDLAMEVPDRLVQYLSGEIEGFFERSSSASQWPVSG